MSEEVTPSSEPIQSLLIDDFITELAKVTTLAGAAATLKPREPKSLQDVPTEHGECLVYESADEPAGEASTLTQARDVPIMVEMRVQPTRSERAAKPVRRLARHMWADAARAILANYGQRVAGVMQIDAGEVVILPDAGDSANGATAFCEFVCRVEHLSNDPTKAR
jgi:hypothetical protein